MLVGGIAELGEAPGLFHYAPAEHGLERRIVTRAGSRCSRASMGNFLDFESVPHGD